MKKNTAGQSIGVEMVSSTTGAAYVGAVTVYITIDAGVQAIGTVGAGLCTSEGNGYFTYRPSQDETNGDQLAFTFIGVGAIPVTIQDFPTQQAVGLAPGASGLLTGSISAYNLIRNAMRKLGLIASNEVPLADELNDNLDQLNELIDIMNLQNLFVYGGDVTTFNLVAGVNSYTMGPSVVLPNFIVNRPIRIPDAYVIYQGVNFYIEPIGQAQYNSIMLPTMQQPIPTSYCYINDNPGILKIYPTPSVAIPICLNIDRLLSAITSMAATITLPPGYSLYMTNALAILLAPEFGAEVPDSVTKVARSAMQKLKKANKLRKAAQFDSALTGGPYATWQTG